MPPGPGPGVPAPARWSAESVARAAAWAVFAGFLFYYGLCCFRVEWGGDFQAHCAGVARLYRQLLYPTHEALDVPGALSTVYTPYVVVVAAIGRLLALTPYRALQLAGVLNLILYLLALHAFVRRFSLHRRHGAVATACLLLTTLFLRWHHFGWSAETSVLTLQVIQAYPSTLGWALALLAFSRAEDLRAETFASLAPGARVLRALLLVALLSFLMLTHPITASWTVGILGLRGLWVLATERDWRFLALLGAVIAAAGGLAGLWPYSPLFGAVSMRTVPEPSAFGRRPFEDFANLYLLAAASALWLGLRWRRHGFVVLALLATFAALELWKALGVAYGNRYSFFTAFWAHFLVAEAMAAALLIAAGLVQPPAGFIRPGSLRWPVVRVGLGLLALVPLAAALPAPMWSEVRQHGLESLSTPAQLWRRPSPHDRYYRRLDGLRPHVGPGDLVVTPISRAVFDVASVTGAAVVAAPYAERVPDSALRDADMNTFFSAEATGEVRRKIVLRYCASKILVPWDRFDLLAALEETFGAVVYRGDGHAVLETASAVPGCRRPDR